MPLVSKIGLLKVKTALPVIIQSSPNAAAKAFKFAVELLGQDISVPTGRLIPPASSPFGPFKLPTLDHAIFHPS